MSPEMEALLQKSAAAAAVAAALVMLLSGLPHGRSRPVGAVLAAGIGITLGILALGAIPKYPPRIDQDRLLVILLPAAILVELAATFIGRAVWALRIGIAAVAGRVLLHNSVYISGTPTLTDEEQWQVLGGLAVALGVLWFGLERLAQREAHRSTLLSLHFSVLAAGLAVMLTGYAYGGWLGIPFAFALAGVALASFAFKSVDLRGAIGVGVVALFSLLVMGRFFGDMPTLIAVLILVAPLLGWLPELLPIGPRYRALSRVALVALVASAGLGLAVQKFAADSKAKSSEPGSNEPNPEDYMDLK